MGQAQWGTKAESRGFSLGCDDALQSLDHSSLPSIHQRPGIVIIYYLRNKISNKSQVNLGKITGIKHNNQNATSSDKCVTQKERKKYLGLWPGK